MLLLPVGVTVFTTVTTIIAVDMIVMFITCSHRLITKIIVITNIDINITAIITIAAFTITIICIILLLLLLFYYRYSYHCE